MVQSRDLESTLPVEFVKIEPVTRGDIESREMAVSLNSMWLLLAWDCVCLKVAKPVDNEELHCRWVHLEGSRISKTLFPGSAESIATEEG